MACGGAEAQRGCDADSRPARETAGETLTAPDRRDACPTGDFTNW